MGKLNIMKSQEMLGELTLDAIKAKLNYFELQVHELHWQTFGLGEHEALGDLYNTLFSTKDEIVELSRFSV